MWPCDRFAGDMAAVRERSGVATRLVVDASDGHRVRLPGEPDPHGGMTMARGGTPEADRALGRRVWHEMQDLLHLS